MFSMIAVHIDNKQDGLDWQTDLVNMKRINQILVKEIFFKELKPIYLCLNNIHSSTELLV